jgi:hypothetical protein
MSHLISQFLRSYVTEIQIEQSLAKWSITLEIPRSTLSRWTYAMGLKAPFDNSKMITALSYGLGTAENARTVAKQNSEINIQKIERALEWL